MILYASIQLIIKHMEKINSVRKYALNPNEQISLMHSFILLLDRTITRHKLQKKRRKRKQKIYFTYHCRTHFLGTASLSRTPTGCVVFFIHVRLYIFISVPRTRVPLRSLFLRYQLFQLFWMCTALLCFWFLLQ